MCDEKASDQLCHDVTQKHISTERKGEKMVKNESKNSE